MFTLLDSDENKLALDYRIYWQYQTIAAGCWCTGIFLLSKISMAIFLLFFEMAVDDRTLAVRLLFAFLLLLKLFPLLFPNPPPTEKERKIFITDTVCGFPSPFFLFSKTAV